LKKINLAIFTLLVCLFVNPATATQKSNNRTAKKPFFLLSLIAQAAALPHSSCESIVNLPLSIVTKHIGDNHGPIGWAPDHALVDCLNAEVSHFEECVTREMREHAKRYIDCTATPLATPHTYSVSGHRATTRYSIIPASSTDQPTNTILYRSIFHNPEVGEIAIYTTLPVHPDL
jgi:hypothetical protein